MGRVFPLQHRPGFQHVGQPGGDVADLVARRLLVPREDLLIHQRAGGFGQRQRVGEHIGGGFGAVGEAQQPVGGDAERTRAFAHHLRIGQARARTLQKLRHGRAIHPDGPGERALAAPAQAHGFLQARAEQGRTEAFVDFFRHLLIKIPVA